ncbi:MAG: ABC transporter ATP-binding protein [Neisseria sp.]|nr:ABC transporter ATP-binding protein [Neisseria sp.]
MTEFAIHIRDARKTYANGFHALNGVSFDVEAGEFFALLGPNGAGKTTLISAMAGLLKLTAGSIEIMGFDVNKQPFEVRRHLGVVPQELVFDPFFTVREALRFQSGYFGIRRNDDWIDEVLHHLGLSDKAHTNTRNLSGGMKRRLMVAQALVHKPPVIVLDEPTAGVDVELRQGLWAFMQSLNRQGHTIVLTTHYLEEAQSLCARIAMLKHGELVALDRTECLLHSEQGVCVAITLSDKLPESLQSRVKSQDGNEWILQLDNYDELSFVLRAVEFEHNKIENLRIVETDLEDVFVRLMNEGKAGAA